VLDAAHGMGLRVPDDVAIAGFDDIELASLVNPALTTVANPAFTTGREAGLLLTERMTGIHQGPPRIVTLPSPLVVRASS
jgi:LacI family transcriptional regulator, galactose operon repressor